MGFLGKQSAIAVYDCDLSAYSLDALRAKLASYAFTLDTPDTDAVKLVRGWVNFNAMSEPFRDFINLDRFYVWSMRYDTRRPNAARIKMLVDEAIAKAEANGEQKVNRSALRAQIALRELVAAPWIPHIVDVIYDVKKRRLYISTLHEMVLDQFDYLMDKTFGDEVDLLPAPTADPFAMSDAFAASLDGDDSQLIALVGLETFSCTWDGATRFRKGASKSTVTTVATDSGKAALAQDFQIEKVRATFVSEAGDEIQLDMDAYGHVCRVKFPKIKLEKGDDPSGILYINADLLSVLSDIPYNTFEGDTESMQKHIEAMREERRELIKGIADAMNEEYSKNGEDVTVSVDFVEDRGVDAVALMQGQDAEKQTE